MIMNYTLQFIPIHERETLLRRIREAMMPGDVFILSEKLTLADQRLNEYLIDLHHEFKRQQGYSDLEIAQKRQALEDVLVPETREAHVARLHAAGFSRCDVWLQCLELRVTDRHRMTSSATPATKLLPELVSDRALESRWIDGPLSEWRALLPEQFNTGLAGALRRSPSLAGGHREPTAAPYSGHTAECCSGGHIRLRPNRNFGHLAYRLNGVLPLAQRAFELWAARRYRVAVDWKWERLAGAIAPLQGRRVLDVGCGNGYHCWRMLGEGAAEVIGVDPTPLFVLQFKALHYLRQQCIHVLPVTLEAIPEHLPVFDTVFSMGVLYHRRNPMEHLVSLRNKLSPGGQLVLETLVIEGDENALLEPNGRYARMGNVWQLPSPGLAARWLALAGFSRVEIVDVGQTSVEEQRRTPG